MILGIGALTSIVGAIPALFDRGHTLDDITHSLVVQMGVGASSFLMILVFGLAGIQRRADAGRSPWPAYWGMLTLLFAAGMSAIILPAWSAHRLALDLDARGVPAQAHVVRQFSEGCGKNGCVTKLEYSFSAGKEGRTFRGFASEGNASRYPTSEYEYAVSTKTIPILYDPENPDRSAVYWSDHVHRQAGGGLVSTTVEVLTALLVFMVALLAGMFYPAARAASAARSRNGQAST